MSVFACLLLVSTVSAQAQPYAPPPGYAPAPQPYAQPAQPYAQPAQQPYAQPAQQPYAQPQPQPYAQPQPQPYAQPQQQPAPAAEPAPEPAAQTTAPQEPQKKSAMDAVPWKLLSKVGSGVAYGAWVVLWTVSIPLFALGATLWGLSTSPALSGSAAGVIGGGAAIFAVGGLVFLLGTAALACGVGLGITTTVLQTLKPDADAAESPLSGFIPRTLLL